MIRLRRRNRQDHALVTKEIPPSQLLDLLVRDVAISPGTLERLRQWLASEDARFIAKMVLVLLAAGAFSSMAVVAPTGARGFAKILKPFITNTRRRRRVIARLTRERLSAAKVSFDGLVTLNLTKKGQAAALKAHAEALTLIKPKVWDKQWRMVLFDVPEKDRAGREVLRRKLHELGFYQIQKSVWVLPWPCEAELSLFRERFGLDQAIRILTIPDGDEFQDARQKFFSNN